MSFKTRYLQLLTRFDITPAELGRRLGYDSAEKLRRLKRDENNNPSYEILRDILLAFPDLNARWLILGGEESILEDPVLEYGHCKECIRKDIVIAHLHDELAARDRKIELLQKDCDGRLKRGQVG